MEPETVLIIFFSRVVARTGVVDPVKEETGNCSSSIIEKK
jgi:hypothetical protein